MVKNEAAHRDNAEEVLQLQRRDEELQLQLNTVLQHNQHQYYNELMIENSPLILVHWYPQEEGRILYSSKNITALGYGLKCPSLLSYLVQAEDYKQLLDAASALQPHQVLSIDELRMQRADGSFLWTTCKLQKDVADSRSCIAIFQDISKQKYTEEQHKRTIAQYETYFSLSPDYIVSFDASIRLKYISPNVERISAFSSLATGKKLSESQLPQAQKWEKLIQGVFHTAQSKEAFLDITDPKGTSSTYQVFLVPEKAEDGTVITVIAYLKELTSQRKHEARLEASQELINTIISEIPIALWTLNTEGFFTAFKGNGLKAIGLDERTIVGTSAYTSIQHPEWINALDKAIQGQASSLVTAKGETYIETTFKPLRNAEGQVNSIVGFSLDVSSRIDYEKKLIYQADLLRHVSDAIISTDNELNILSWNAAAEKMYEWTEEEALGKNRIQLLQTSYYVGEDTARNEFLQQGYWTGEAISYTKSGKQLIEKLSSKQLRDVEGKPTGILTISRDITKKKSIAEILQLTQFSIENTSEAIFWVGQESRIIKANKAACALTHYTEKELLHMHVQDIAVNINEEEWRKYWEKAKKSGTYINEAQLKTKNGRVRTTEVVANFFEYANKEYLFVFVRDISARKLAEEQLLTSLNEKEVLLAEIHHRVKNNMAVISSLLSLQSSYTEDETVRMLFQESCNRIKSMSLIHEKLYQSETFSRINFKDYINDLIAHIRKAHHSSHKHIHIQLDIEEVYMDIVTAVPCGLLLNEMITNAYKHAFHEKDRGTITINLNRRNGKFHLIVKDDGVGLNSKHSNDSTSSMGLMLIQALSTQLNAAIEMTYDQGTCASLIFEELKNKISKHKKIN